MQVQNKAKSNACRPNKQTNTQVWPSCSRITDPWAGTAAGCLANRPSSPHTQAGLSPADGPSSRPNGQFGHSPAPAASHPRLSIAPCPDCTKSPCRTILSPDTCFACSKPVARVFSFHFALTAHSHAASILCMDKLSAAVSPPQHASKELDLLHRQPTAPMALPLATMHCNHVTPCLSHYSMPT